MTHIQVTNFVLADFLLHLLRAQHFYSIYPASTYITFCRANRWQPVVHSGFSAAGQFVTLVYRGKINDLTMWVRHDFVCNMLGAYISQVNFRGHKTQ